MEEREADDTFSADHTALKSAFAYALERVYRCNAFSVS